jgi:cellulose synthase/poly-beta-1,6-N-acetylglucosamine synthase-like glycosyltransferase
MPIFIFFLVLLLVAYAWLIAFYSKGWRMLSENSMYGNMEPMLVSLVIAMRNEAHQLEGLFKSLEAQSIASDNLEIIVVNDHSTDDTWELLQKMKAKFPKLKLLQLEDYLDKKEPILSYKKKALELGISHSTGELIVSTDADCRFPTNWLLQLALFYQQKDACFIAAPVKIQSNRSLVCIFQTLDFITLQGITGAAVDKKFHHLCNGANLAYSRKAYDEVNGFAGINHLASGDDLLLMQKIAERYPERVFFFKSKEVTVSTEPVASWKEFWNQRIRWASKSNHYKDWNIKLVLLMVYLLNLALLAGSLYALIVGHHLFLFILLFVAKFLIEYPFVDKVARFFKQENLLLYFFILQPLHVLYMVSAGTMGLIGGFEWKGRKIKK